MPSQTVPVLSSSLPTALTENISAALDTGTAGSGRDGAAMALFAWLAGVLGLAAWLASRQRAFVRSLGRMVVSQDGIWRSERATTPMLIGAWRPRIVVPADFEIRYPARDCQLMLAHERAHQERGDAVMNSLAAAWLCLFWFNPLMSWALGRSRFDQELACDALVVSRAASGRKRYADALLRVQLTSEAGWRVPVGCHWQSDHPLKERIAMLKNPSPALFRRLAGIAFTVMLTAFGMYFVSSSFAAEKAPAVAAVSAPKFAIDAQELDVREVLQMIARKGARNVLVGDQVKGKITLHLKDVTWPEALNAVVQSMGLVSRESGNITIVDVPAPAN
jgi:beta-lactamase regulating signal transducer with metallopeptidase domain